MKISTLAGLILLCIVVYLSVSHSDLSSQIWLEFLQPFISYHWWSQLQHLLAYSGLMGLLSLTLKKPLLTIAAGLVILGALLEGIQYFLPYRSFDWLDLLFGTIGVLLAYLSLKPFRA